MKNKKKTICCIIYSVILVISCTAPLLKDILSGKHDDITFSEEYKNSPYYERLQKALNDSGDSSVMERTLAAALSQEGYKNYAAFGIDIDKAKKDGLIWTGAELRCNSHGTGNTEYTRWAQAYISEEEEKQLYKDCDWCAIFASWCMYQAGYYPGEEMKKYYYSYCADPRKEKEPENYITAFNLEQENVWYTPLARQKLKKYDWCTYPHENIDPYAIPYKPGGLLFFTWDGTGKYFDHVGIVVSYDSENHVLTYTNGNSDGQVITRNMDLDLKENFLGHPLSQKQPTYHGLRGIQCTSQRLIAKNSSGKIAGAFLFSVYEIYLPLSLAPFKTEYYRSFICSDTVYLFGGDLAYFSKPYSICFNIPADKLYPVAVCQYDIACMKISFTGV